MLVARCGTVRVRCAVLSPPLGPGSCRIPSVAIRLEEVELLLAAVLTSSSGSCRISRCGELGSLS